MALVAAAQLTAQMPVTIEKSVSSPSETGDQVTFTVIADHSDPDDLWYRFRVRRTDEDFRLIRDFGPSNTLDWATIDYDGIYQMETTVRNKRTGEASTASTLHEMSSRVHRGVSVITATRNPLVFIYSAPECPVGSLMRAHFRSPDGVVQRTPAKPCRLSSSMNFYLAGLRASTDYAVWYSFEGGSTAPHSGPEISLTTPRVDLDLPARSVVLPPSGAGPPGVLLQGRLSATHFATDLDGNLVWYYHLYLSKLTRPLPGGYFAGIIDDQGLPQSQHILRIFDLAGVTVKETNAVTINEQLHEMGTRAITAFHHEADILPDGKILVLASAEQVVTDVQGPGDVDVIGDTILVLDQDLQVVWVWDSFKHMDLRQKAILDETCVPGGGGCPPFYLANVANDWLHGNSVQITPDGNLVFSIRHLDWVIKINYNNGLGNGAVIWRLGEGGDFRMESEDPSPWFSHQHDARFEVGDATRLIVFDNGNLRRLSDPAANSRGQVIEIDEANRVARLVVNADLGGYSAALGSAQKLQNGNYHFNSGFLPGGAAISVEVDPAGKPVYGFRLASNVYRSFRLQDLYSSF